MDLTRLCDLMDRLSCWTWDRIVTARSVGAKFGEVSITESLVLDLKVFADQPGHGYEIHVHQVSQVQEARLGADLELWLRMPNGYFGYSIQAKRVGDDTAAYPQLGHRGDPAAASLTDVAPRGPFQYDTLLAHSSQVGSVAMHLFYNGWTDNDPAFRKVARAFADPPDRKLYGCAVVPTMQMKWIREAGKKYYTNRVASFAAVSAPWSTLFRLGGPRWGSGPVGWEPPTPAPEGLNAAIDTRYVQDWISAALDQGFDAQEDLDASNWPSGYRTIGMELPEYVYAAMEGQLSTNPRLPKYVAVIGDRDPGREY